MVSREELQEFAEQDRRANEQADCGGGRPKLAPLHAAIFTALGVFALLDVFAAITLPDRETAFWPIVILTVLCSGSAAALQWWRERSWLDRYTRAMLGE